MRAHQPAVQVDSMTARLSTAGKSTNNGTIKLFSMLRFFAHFLGELAR